MPTGPSRLRLQLEAAFELQGRAEQRGERHRLGQQPRHRLRIVVALEEPSIAGPSRTSRPREVERLRPRKAGRCRRPTSAEAARSAALMAAPPRHQASTPFCACRRFSASSNTSRLRTVDHLVGHLLAAMGGQAMHEDGVRRRAAHQLAVDLIGRQQVLAPALVLVAHRHPAVGNDRRGVLRPPPSGPRADMIFAARGARRGEPLLASAAIRADRRCRA